MQAQTTPINPNHPQPLGGPMRRVIQKSGVFNEQIFPRCQTFGLSVRSQWGPQDLLMGVLRLAEKTMRPPLILPIAVVAWWQRAAGTLRPDEWQSSPRTALGAAPVSPVRPAANSICAHWAGANTALIMTSVGRGTRVRSSVKLNHANSLQNNKYYPTPKKMWVMTSTLVLGSFL